jgi:hypothetical protein
MLAAWERCKPMLIAGHKLVLTVEEERRNLDQNALLHALLNDVAEQCEWGGRKWDTDDWKRLLTAGWLRARKESPVMVPAIDGQGFDVLYRRTSQLSKAECAELIDYIQAWAAERGIRNDSKDSS